MNLVKTFTLRQGRITKGQLAAVRALFPLYGIYFQQSVIDPVKIFGNKNPLFIEIGFGRGDATLQIAYENPDKNYLGIEVHTPGIGTVLRGIHNNNLSNLKIIKDDALEVLKHMTTDNSVSGFHIFFPDPWPKKRHHKRRIINESFVALLGAKLKEKGYIHFTSDWEDYAYQALNIFKNNEKLVNLSQEDGFIPRPLNKPETKFERRGLALNHKIYDLMFIKK